MLLRLFGAEMGPNCHFYPISRVWTPWNLICEDQVTAGDGVEIYHLAPARFSSHTILSHNSCLFGAVHDFDDPAFPLLAFAVEVGAYAWVYSLAFVGPGSRSGKVRCSVSVQWRHATWNDGAFTPACQL